MACAASGHAAPDSTPSDEDEWETDDEDEWETDDEDEWETDGKDHHQDKQQHNIKVAATVPKPMQAINAVASVRKPMQAMSMPKMVKTTKHSRAAGAAAASVTAITAARRATRDRVAAGTTVDVPVGSAVEQTYIGSGDYSRRVRQAGNQFRLCLHAYFDKFLIRMLIWCSASVSS